MAKYAKWLGGGLGWAFGGPVGAILGFALGSLVDEAEVKVYRGNGTGNPASTGRAQYAGSVNDFTASLLVLSAAVMKSDGLPKKSELDYIRNFFIRQFGEQKAYQDMLLLKEMLKRDISVHDVCAQIRQFMPLASRLQLIHYLYGISKADGDVHELELQAIEQIGGLMGVSAADMNSMKAMYYRDTQSDYKILEINSSATDEEVKKAYRKMAVKFHPDKVAKEGADVQKAATEKFRKVQEAYENIKKKRGLN